MSRLYPIKPEEAIRAFKKVGWEIARQKGSHISMVKKEVKFILVIPMHKGRDLRIGLLRGLIAKAGLTVEEFQNLL